MSTEQDAKRYQWLKENAILLEFVISQDESSMRMFTHEGGNRHSMPRLDAAIDEAMAQSTEGRK